MSEEQPSFVVVCLPVAVASALADWRLKQIGVMSEADAVAYAVSDWLVAQGLLPPPKP